MRVVDASTLVHALTDKGVAGRSAKERMRGRRLYAPDLIDLEVTHALRGLVRGKQVDLFEAESARRTLGTMALERVGHRAYLPRVWELRDNYTTYDAAYIALAESLGAPLLTSDARLARGSGARCRIELVM